MIKELLAARSMVIGRSSLLLPPLRADWRARAN